MMMTMMMTSSESDHGHFLCICFNFAFVYLAVARRSERASTTLARSLDNSCTHEPVRIHVTTSLVYLSHAVDRAKIKQVMFTDNFSANSSYKLLSANIVI